MSDDIVTRLRVPLPYNLAGMTTKQLGDERHEAADEIERLRKQRDGWLQMLKDLYNTAISDPNAYAFDLPLLNMLNKVVKAVRGD